MEKEGIFPHSLHHVSIKRFQLTSVNGKEACMPLDLGGFGISRYDFDHYLYQLAEKAGVNFLLNTSAESISYQQNNFTVKISSQAELTAPLVIGAFGKRSKVDHALNRPFIKKRSPYVGVKYHLHTSHPEDLISLHNFKDGYCGISKVSNTVSNLCYLTHRNNVKSHASIRAMEEAVLFRNPFLKKIFTESDFLFEKPEVINEVSFEPKQPVENHIIMAGDAAGMIAPLCGNGMAMAIHGAYLASEWAARFLKGEISREALEEGYASAWKTLFAQRLWVGRQMQRLFGSEALSNLAVEIIRRSKRLSLFLMRYTHGQPF